MMLLSAQNLSKSYRGEPVFSGLSLAIEERERVALVGVNGCGKSTLLAILAGAEKPDAGEVVRTGGVRVQYLPQNPMMQAGQSLYDYVAEGLPPDGAERIEAKSLLTRLGLPDTGRDIASLSGGQRRRAAIAKALAAPCELLILDEPTNHIDEETAAFLEERLARFSGAILMVTHDRYFLDRVSTRILELDAGALYSYGPGYAEFLAARAEREEMTRASARKASALLEKELAWAQRGARARGTKSRFRLARIDDLREQTKLRSDESLKLSSISSRLGKKTIVAEQVSKSYGGTPLFAGFSYTVLRDDRIGIVGPNGCGKSTLMNLLAGRIPPDSGTVSLGDTVRVGYFSQEGRELPLEQKVIDYIRGASDRIETPEGTLSAAQMLERFLFPPELQWNEIGRLSGGERRRLALLRVLMEAPNLLLLDEPTNDLDIATLAVLEDYLDSFDGAVLAVSHDRYFLDRIATPIFSFEQGEVVPYEGGYTDYRAKRTEREKKRSAPEETSGGEKGSRPARTHARKLSFKESRELETIDARIAALEAAVADCDRRAAEAAADYARLTGILAEKSEREAELEQATERWIYLQELLERIEAEKQGKA